ncbi:hypothetical protein PG999_002670 [Apiospora kogelbergensis]|uniref:CENP-V/GFA domain-containing protein n=1 Tax=Apiospora kogelbergensis TaxID=1337665 RepID=A0AAW0R907_9PEZI
MSDTKDEDIKGAQEQWYLRMRLPLRLHQVRRHPLAGAARVPSGAVQLLCLHPLRVYADLSLSWCRTLSTYLLTFLNHTDPAATNVKWHNDSRSRCAAYQFNTKEKDQLFCPKCGTSLGIDFRDFMKPHTYAISARTIYGVNLDELKYKKLDGVNLVKPAGDLSGHYWDEEKGEMK